uniref:Uncharacterized protein n=1 Tax=Eutreptiella gymnastica TaxID=73025 RepID=A0A7S4G4J6_9EUGL
MVLGREAWWEVVGLVTGGAGCVSESWESILKTGVYVMLLTILQCLRYYEGTLGPLVVASIFPHTREVKGTQMARTYPLQAPVEVKFESFPGLVNQSRDRVEAAYKRAKGGGATLFQLQKAAEEGADFLCTLPLASGDVLLLGLLTHGQPWLPLPDNERAVYIEFCEEAFWRTMDPLRQTLPGPGVLVLIYTTPENVTISAVENQLQKPQWVSARGPMTLLLMEQEGVQNLFGPLWPMFNQCVMCRPRGDTSTVPS